VAYATRNILMSIKPKFGYEIINGLKRFELRRVAGFQLKEGDRVFLYFSSPVKKVVGLFDVGVVYKGRRSELRRIAKMYGEVGLTEEDWNYVDEEGENMMLEARNPRRCMSEVTLEDLRAVGLKNPPPSYTVIKRADLLNLLATRCLGFSEYRNSF